MASLGNLCVQQIFIYSKRVKRHLLQTIQMGHFVSVLLKHYKCSDSTEWKHIMKTITCFVWLLIGSDYRSAKVWYPSAQQFWPTLIDWSIHTMGQINYDYPLKKYHFENHCESIYWPCTPKHWRICVEPSLHHYIYLVHQETLTGVRSVLSLSPKCRWFCIYRSVNSSWTAH